MRLTADQLKFQIERMYSIGRDQRLAEIPALSQGQVEQLKQLQSAVWDGNVISKSHRDVLYHMSLIDRWNGWQIVNIYGLCVLETLGLLEEEWKFKRNCR